MHVGMGITFFFFLQLPLEITSNMKLSLEGKDKGYTTMYVEIREAKNVLNS